MEIPLSAKIDLSGHRYGSLVVTSAAKVEKGRTSWNCECDCGKSVVRHQLSLRSGRTLSCGCRRKIPNTGHFKATHGITKRVAGQPIDRIYGIWATMKSRTTNPKAHGYDRYGGLGITVCQEWLDSFEKFLLDMGRPPSDDHTLDRKESDAGYTPDNCRWATYKEQNRNRKNVVLVDYDGAKWPLSELAEKYGLPVKALYMRVTKYGWDLSKALSTPVRLRSKTSGQ